MTDTNDRKELKMAEKMTYAEFLEKARAFFEVNENEELLEKTNELIEKHTEKNAKRRNSMTAVQKENLGIEKEILEILANENDFILSTDLANRLGLNTQKTNGVAGNLVKQGKLKAEKIKVKGVGVRTGYTLAD